MHSWGYDAPIFLSHILLKSTTFFPTVTHTVLHHLKGLKKDTQLSNTALSLIHVSDTTQQDVMKE